MRRYGMVIRSGGAKERNRVSIGSAKLSSRSEPTSIISM